MRLLTDKTPGAGAGRTPAPGLVPLERMPLTHGERMLRRRALMVAAILLLAFVASLASRCAPHRHHHHEPSRARVCG